MRDVLFFTRTEAQKNEIYLFYIMINLAKIIALCGYNRDGALFEDSLELRIYMRRFLFALAMHCSLLAVGAIPQCNPSTQYVIVHYVPKFGGLL